MGSGKVPSSFDLTFKDADPHDVSLSVDLMGLEDINPTVTLVGGQAIKTDSKFEADASVKTDVSLDVQPVTGSLSLDLKPVKAAVEIAPLNADLCINVGLNKIPPTRLCAPYSSRVGFSLFGIEIFGFSFAGERRLDIQPISEGPQVAWGGEEVVYRHRARPGAEPENRHKEFLRIQIDE
jgi:hypothetical protein